MILRALVIVCMILQILHGNFGNAMLCMLSLILLLVPLFVQNRFKITLPNGLEIAIYLFYIFRRNIRRNTQFLWSNSFLGYNASHNKWIFGSSSRILNSRFIK